MVLSKGRMPLSTSRRPRPAWIILSLLAVVIVLNQSVTRGYVTDEVGRPLIDADVWLADSASVVRELRTDTRGFFWTVHPPFARSRYRLLICRARNTVYVAEDVDSGIFRSEYAIGSYVGRFPDTPSTRGWQAAAPLSCPSEVVPPAA